MNFNDDMTRCTGEDCPIKFTCLRYVQGERDVDGMYSYFAPSPKEILGECTYYIEYLPAENEPINNTEEVF